MIKQTRLFVADLDGTLINSSYEISRYSIETLNALISRGLNFTYATARSFNSASKFTHELDLKWPVIVYNGALIVDGKSGAIINVQAFLRETSRKIEATLECFGINPLVYTLIDSQEKVLWHCDRQNDHVKSYIESRKGDLRFEPKRDGEPIYQGTIFYYTAIDDKVNLEPVYRHLSKLPGLVCSLKKELYSNEYFLEIMPELATKARALERLKTIRHFDKLVCFGDEINDLEMLQMADVAVAMSNAIDPVKQVATDIAQSNDQDGVARWIGANFQDFIDN